MATLKELVLYQQMTGEDDLAIIKLWFMKNNMEGQGISMITQLAESQLNKLELILNKAKTWIPYLPDLEKSNKNLTHEQARNLQSIITMYLLGMDLKESNYYNWAKENIPKIELPTIIFVPCVKWLEEKYEIKFKEIKK